MARKSQSSVDIASSLFDVPVRRHGNFDTEEARYVHLLRVAVNELQREFQKEGDIFYDKIKFKEKLAKSRMKVPMTYAYMTHIDQFESFWKGQKSIEEFVFKPNHLSQGKYVHVIHKENEQYVEIDGSIRSKKYFRQISEKILAEKHARKGIIMEEVIHSHPDLTKLQGNDGLVDMRLYFLYDVLLFGKLRFPCKLSNFYGNTGRHATAVFVGDDGIIKNTSLMDNTTTSHPDTNINMDGMKVPFWDEFHQTGLIVAKLFKIPFHSVDMTVDRDGNGVVCEAEKIPFLAHFTKRGCVELINIIQENSGIKVL